jgi:hypothetical protein
MKKNILSVIIVIAVVVGSASISWIKEHGWNRPYFEWGISDLAKHLVGNNFSPRGCFDLMWHGMGQQEGEAQAECVYQYASLAKDPSACELLMPSSYGLSCVGGAIDSPECGFNQGYEVQWNEGNPVLKSSLKDCQKNIQRSETGEACCFIAKIGFVKDENDCSPLKNQERFYNECLDRLSFKNHDPTTCEGITDKNLKVACIVRAKAMKQDPSICTGCTPLLETLEDIK